MMVLCKICNSEMRWVFLTRILGKYDVNYFFCRECGFLCTEQPYWLAEAYTDAIVMSDTGTVSRTILVARKLATALYFCLPDHGQGKWLDYAGGYGTLTRLMRDYGFDFYWSDKYSANLFARGFELPEGAKCVGITAVEAIEHSEDPHSFIGTILEQTGANYFLFTTELFAGEPLAPEAWWYYGLNSGQHISLFQARTLSKLAANLGCHYYSLGGLHLFSKTPVKAGLWRFVTGKSSVFLMPIVRRFLSSKLVSDHLELATRLSKVQTADRS
jgi:hypothetical protein